VAAAIVLSAPVLYATGNFSGAIQRLEEAGRLRPEEPSILVELGECWQHLRQFDKAFDYYRQAIASCEQAAANGQALSAGVLTLAHYRAAVLLAAKGMNSQAEQHLAAAVALDPAFKDARERLDKLRTS